MSDQPPFFKEYQSENMHIKMQRELGCQVVMQIYINSTPVKAAYLAAVKNINKQVSFPGFRKGHAPVQVIEQKFAKDIQDEWRAVLGQTAFSEALKMSQCYPRTEKSVRKVEITKLSQEEGAEIHLEYECAPEIPNIDVSGFSLEPGHFPSIEDKEVDASIYERRLAEGSYETLESQPAAEGQFVMVDIYQEQGGEEPHYFEKGSIYEVGSAHTSDWINQLVVGMQPGDVKDGELPCHEHDHAGHNHSCKLRLLEVRQGSIAPLNEEFLKKYQVENEEDLRTNVRKYLENMRQRNEFSHKARQVENFLLETYTFDVPKSLYETAVRQISRSEVLKIKQQEGLSEEEQAAKIAEVQSKVEEDLKRAVRRFLLLNKVADEEKIEVTQQEMYLEHLYEVLQEKKQPSEANEQETARLYSKIRQEKALAFLTDQINQRSNKLSEEKAG